ncbi:MAG: AMP-binding protein [Myxococcota bacterium]|jgi:fatty-acyl-CoA synthase|nr:AMP-binding protein [Myxococcota bacterium]
MKADESLPILESTVGSVLREAAELDPDGVGLVSCASDIESSQRLRFGELLESAETVARALLARFDPGDHVAVWAPNLPEWVLLQFGMGLAGLVMVPLNPAYRRPELVYALRQSKAKGIFYAREYRGSPMEEWVRASRDECPMMREAVSLGDWTDFCASASAHQKLPEVSPLDPVQIQYTSGTTGAPKGATLHHRGLTNNGRLVVSSLGARPGEAFLNPAPLFHVAGCVVGVLGSLACRATLVQPVSFEPGLALALCERERVTTMGGVPTMLIAMMEHPDFQQRDLSSLRTVGIGGAAVPAELVRSIEASLGIDLIVAFGQTEASCSITKTRAEDSAIDKAETIGLPLPQTEVQIVDPENGRVVEPGRPGEICTRGYGVMHGYHDNPEATAATIDEEGWLHTGDLGTMDPRGYCKIVGRIKDMIIRGGENIYPREIEEVLFAHEAVGDVAVVGVPDEKWGEQVVAFVRLAPGAPPKTDHDALARELHAYVRERLAPQKTPREWFFEDELPTTASGKIQKFALRDRYIAEKA